jgi:hypothetical protein
MSTQAVPELYWHGEQLQNCSQSAKAALPVIPPPPNFAMRTAIGARISPTAATHANSASGSM